MTIEGMQGEYDKTVEQSALMTEEIKDTFEKLYFERNSIKTLYFNISAEYESYQTRDNSRLGKVLYALGYSAICPEFRIEYTVAEPEKCKNELLARAVMDSKEKAEVLTKAADVSLGDILTMDYSWEGMDGCYAVCNLLWKDKGRTVRNMEIKH